MNSTIHTAEELRAELEKALLALDKAISCDRICQLEKDILLERLRRIYEGIGHLSFEAEIKEEVTPIPFSQPERKSSETPVDKPTESGRIETTVEWEIVQSETLSVQESDEKGEKETVHCSSTQVYDFPFTAQAPIDKEIIESLYGDEPCRKSGEMPEKLSSQPIPNAVPPKQFESPEPSAKVLNETFSDTHTKDVASMLSSQALGSLRRKIGLNDRLMLMNDLFNNDPELYEQTLDELESFETIDDAYIYLYEHFTLDDSKEGVKLLVALLESRFS